MRAGLLDRRIEIQAWGISKDAYGGIIEDFATWHTVWASYRVLEESEFFSAAALNERVDAVFRVRNIPGLDCKMRVIYKGVAYDIYPPRELQRNQGFDLYGKAVNKSA